MNRIQWLTPSGSPLLVIALAMTAPSVAFNPPSPSIPIRSEAELPEVLAGKPLQHRLQTPLAGATWEKLPLRGVLRALGKTSQVAIVRDRRLDPRHPITLTVQQQSHLGVLQAIAAKVDAEARVLGNVVYFGPPASARVLRTLATIRSVERARLLGGRAPQTVQWADLTEPRDILTDIAHTFDFQILNPEQVPHDLWEGAILPKVTAAQALTLVLIQFDLTFAWKQRGRAIQIVPLPQTPNAIAIQQIYRVPASRRRKFLAWKQEHQDVLVNQVRGRLMVRGLLEAHESLRDVLRGDTPSSGKPSPGNMTGETTKGESPPQVAPLKRRRFTLAVKGVPAQAIIRQLEASGITVEYDDTALNAAGIDFATPVTMDVKDAGPQEFLAALFDPLGLDFEFSGTKIHLQPQ